MFLQGHTSLDYHWPTIQPLRLNDATGKHNVLHNFSRVFHVCHMCSGRICSIGGSANSGILWQLLIGLQSARHWTQGTLDDVDPLGHPHKVSFWLFGQKHSQYWPAGGNFVGLWQCSSWSSLHKKYMRPTDWLRIFYSPVQLSYSNCLSSEISFMLLRLCWETVDWTISPGITSCCQWWQIQNVEKKPSF